MSQYSISPEDETPATEIDPTKLEQLMNDVKSKQNLTMAVLGGLIASIVSAIIWSIVTYATGYQIGFMAIGVGFLVGYAVNFFGKGITIPFGVVGASFSLFGCLLGNIFTTIIAAALQEKLPVSAILTVLVTTPSVIIEIMKDTFSPMDLLFYGIAVYEGYRFSFRKISEEEIDGLRKTQISPPTKQV